MIIHPVQYLVGIIAGKQVWCFGITDFVIDDSPALSVEEILCTQNPDLELPFPG